MTVFASTFPTTIVLVLLFLVSSSLIADDVTEAAFSISFSSSRCRRRRLTTAQRCFNPPVERTVDISAYSGLWHQLYTSGDASIVSNNTCVTANYTILPTSPPSISVLNCEFRPRQDARPQCVRGTATRRPGAQRPTQLQVSFFQFAPPGQYNIAALLGNANYGYYAAAIYSCRRLPNGQLIDGFYLIARSPYAPRSVRRMLIRRLRCNGYQVSMRTGPKLKPYFEPSFNGRTCQYIKYNGYKFDVNTPVPVF